MTLACWRWCQGLKSGIAGSLCPWATLRDARRISFGGADRTAPQAAHHRHLGRVRSTMMTVVGHDEVRAGRGFRRLCRVLGESSGFGTGGHGQERRRTSVSGAEGDAGKAGGQRQQICGFRAVLIRQTRSRFRWRLPLLVSRP